MTASSVESLMQTALDSVVNTGSAACETKAPAGICGVYYAGRPYYRAAAFSGLGLPTPTETTGFGLGSVSKSFTTAIIGQLGHKALNAAIAGNIPPDFSLQTAATQWSLAQLASFDSGLPRYPENQNGQPLPGADWQTYVSYLDAFVPPSDPSYDYSNIAIGLASQIAMYMDGLTSFAAEDTLQWWQDKLFTPLGMTATGAFDSSGGTTLGGDPQTGLVTPYAWSSGDYKPIRYAGWCPWGSAGRAYSTCEDMLGFVQAIVGAKHPQGPHHHRIKEGLKLSIEAVTPPVYPVPNATKITQALAWVVNAQDANASFVAKDGGLQGVSAFVTACRSKKLGVVLLTNMKGIAVQAAAGKLTKALIDL